MTALQRAISFVVGRLLPAAFLFLAVSIGWLSRSEVPAGKFFATVIPLMSGTLPPSIVGHGKMSGTPVVPDDMMPQPRPDNEILLDLPSGDKLPANGIGMCCRATAYDDVLVYRTVLWYLLLGGRHIDGAHLYLNHKAIGEGINEAVKRGVPRREIFFTTKIFPTQFGYESTLQNVEQYLDQTKQDYIDLVLLHFPSVSAFGPMLSSPCSKEGKSARECRIETWKALSELQASGKIRNAGVSNFAVKHLKDLEGIGVPIANNQIQFNPFEPEYVVETFKYCAANGITITAYSPLGGLMDRSKAEASEILSDLSHKYDRRLTSIMLRWALQRGCAVIPGTGNPSHMLSNLAVYDFELSDEDMSIINNLKNVVKGFNMDVREIE